MCRAPPVCAAPRLPTPYSYEISLQLGKKILQSKQIHAPACPYPIMQAAQFRQFAGRYAGLRGQPLPDGAAVGSQAEATANGIEEVLEQARPRLRPDQR